MKFSRRRQPEPDPAGQVPDGFDPAAAQDAAAWASAADPAAAPGTAAAPAPEPGDLLVEELPSAPVTVLAAVNLLPQTYARRAAVRRAKVFAVVALLVAALIAALAWLVANQQKTSAQEQLDAATAERAMLQAEAVKYSDVPRVFATVAAAEQQLALAMGNEVRWSFFLNDLALTMPSGVSLETLQVTSPAPGTSPQAVAPAAANAAAAAGASGVGVPGLGTMNVSAKALSYNTVANWLDSLAKLPTLTDPYIGSITAGTEEGVKIVTYSSTATLTADALSMRYLPQAQAQAESGESAQAQAESGESAQTQEVAP
jgi:Tfp pilus assembly protein PilN